MSLVPVKKHVEQLIPPYHGKLVNLLIRGEERNELTQRASKLTSVQLSARSLCDLELLSTGAFSPLNRFMSKADYTRVLQEMRLANGTLFPIPITLPVDPKTVRLGDEVALRSANYDLLAIMTVEEVFEWDSGEEAQLVLGTQDVRHPLVAEMASWGRVYVSGALRVLSLPKHYDFTELRKTPMQVRQTLEGLGSGNVVAFQTRNPMHRAHEELTKRAAAQIGGSLLIHPVVGMTKPGDVDHYTRARAFKILVERYYDKAKTLLSLLPLAMRMAGPREALWHAIIRRNHGANHFIVGRDHAGPGKDSSGCSFYGRYDAQELLQKFESEIGVRMTHFQEIVYLPEEDRYEEQPRVPNGARVVTLPGTQVRDDYLSNGKRLPEWFTRPETAAILSTISLPLHQQGFCLWFTGLSGPPEANARQIMRYLTERGFLINRLDIRNLKERSEIRLSA